MRACFHPDYTIPLPPGHAFPMEKYRALYALLLEEGLLSPEDVLEPGEADWSDLALAHSPAYLERLRTGTMDPKEIRRLGFPWSPRVLRRARLAVQGTLNATMLALQDGIAANLAGGTHHAFADHGEGFCLLNDMAVAIRVWQRSGWIRRALIVDLDVHQGNGNAALFADDPSVYTFSMHGAKNYPFQKPPSDQDVALPDGCRDAEYLEALAEHLPRAFDAARPDVVYYLAGVDPVAGDRFGRLAMSPAGLAARDRLVLETTRTEGVPVVLLLSGGYAASAAETARLHAITHRVARDVYAPHPLPTGASHAEFRLP
ncbi:MAG TPA: histone deacetylase [Stenomitos sp.]